MPNCSVFSCKKRSETSSLFKDNTTFHLFPIEPMRRAKWIKACGNHKTWNPKRTSTVCSQHFDSSYFILQSNSKRKLRHSAVPTLNLTESCSSDQCLPLDKSNRISKIPSAKEIITSVYHYLQSEYDQLKSFTDTRTAAATGVSEQTVSAILDERKRPADCRDTSTDKRAKKSKDVRTEESSGCLPNVKQTGDSRQEKEIIMQALKIEIEEEDRSSTSPYPVPVVSVPPRPHVTPKTKDWRPYSNTLYLDVLPISQQQTEACKITVKCEPFTPDEPNSVPDIAPEESLARVKIEPNDELIHHHSTEPY